MLPKKPFEKIAMSLSGGGYRAAAFHLGALAYLNQVKFDGISLLDRIQVFSSVSGGSFTNAAYSTAVCKEDGKFEHAFNNLYRFMKEVDLVDICLDKLSNPNWNTHKNRNLINAFAEAYYESFLDDNFDILWNKPNSQLKEVIFNATEFSHGITFRFQKTKDDLGYIGNYYHKIPTQSAKEIRIADVVAASSCFPGGFEPIIYPDDFQFKGSKELKSRYFTGSNTDSINIMDGGIVDNQGIGSIMLSEGRLQEKNEPYFDLFIVSDVASSDMQPLKTIEVKDYKGFGKWSFHTYKILGILFTFVSIGCVVGLYFSNSKIGIIAWSIMTVLFIISSVLCIFLGRLVVKKIPKWGKDTIPLFFLKHLSVFHYIKFGRYKNMVQARLQSVLKMVSEIFLKQIRRLSYNRLYEQEKWKKRVMMNAVYELTKQKVKQRQDQNEGKISPEILEPGPDIKRVAEKASSMGTTLWFTPADLEGEENKLDSLVACGSFTICFNLLEYIERLQQDKEYDQYKQAMKENVKTLHNALQKDWSEFKKNPFYIFNFHHV